MTAAAGRRRGAGAGGRAAAEAAATGAGPGRYRWRRDADVVVVGSGAAGISVALTAAARGLRVLVVTKDLAGGATPQAQGGLAAALGAGDSAAAHVSDTLTAGAGLCEPDVVAQLAAAAPGTIDWLTGLGALLETRDLRLEGGHSAHRIVHSGDDATGAEVHRALLSTLLSSEVEILDRAVALDLATQPAADLTLVREARHAAGDGIRPGAAAGAAAANAVPAGPLIGDPVPGQPATGQPVTGLVAAFIGADGRLTPGVISARAVVIAAGGLGQAFGTTSNPPGATGDGVAIAARAGAVLRDLEFVQFHPTVLWLPEANGQCPLVTEALRGAGAVLRDLDGTPLMAGHDPRGDLAPRDVVAARMAEVIAAGDAGHLWLDATGLGRDLLEDGFPTVTAACRKHGIDPVTHYIPVVPGAHYSCGGILADLHGRTTLPGLYAVGEAASTGVQGANRLASNSVTEAIIAGRRAGEAIAAAVAADGCVNEPSLPQPATWEAVGSSEWPLAGLPTPRRSGATAPAAPMATPNGASEPAMRNAESVVAGRMALAQAMSRYAGVIRDAEGLERLLRIIAGADCGAGAAGHEELTGGAARVEYYELFSPDGFGEQSWAVGAGEKSSPVRDDGVELEAVEAANLRTVSLLIAAGAVRRAESRGCHRRRDAGATGAAPWHTLLRWDGQRLVVTEELVGTEEAKA
jgi:L-aspartate oxidase